MKRLLAFSLLYLPFLCMETELRIYGQNIGINENGDLPHNSAILDIKTTDKGLLIPRLTSAEMNAISTPANGLIIFNTDYNILYSFNGTVWESWAQAIQNQSYMAGMSGGSSNSYTLSPSPPVGSYIPYQKFGFVANHTNTGAATINISNLGSQNLVRFDGSSVITGNIVNGRYYEIVYDGSRFLLLNPSASSVLSYSRRTSSGLWGSNNVFVSTGVTHTVGSGEDGIYLCTLVHRVGNSINQKLAVFSDFGGSGQVNLIQSASPSYDDGLLVSGTNVVFGTLVLSEGDVLTLALSRNGESGNPFLLALSGFDLVRIR